MVFLHECHALAGEPFYHTVGKESLFYYRHVLGIRQFRTHVDYRTQFFLANEIIIFLLSATYHHRAERHCLQGIHRRSETVELVNEHVSLGKHPLVFFERHTLHISYLHPAGMAQLDCFEPFRHTHGTLHEVALGLYTHENFHHTAVFLPSGAFRPILWQNHRQWQITKLTGKRIHIIAQPVFIQASHESVGLCRCIPPAAIRPMQHHLVDTLRILCHILRYAVPIRVAISRHSFFLARENLRVITETALHGLLVKKSEEKEKQFVPPVFQWNKLIVVYLNNIVADELRQVSRNLP